MQIWEDLGVGQQGREHLGLLEAALLPSALWSSAGRLQVRREPCRSKEGLCWGRGRPPLLLAAPVTTCHVREVAGSNWV